MKVKATPLTALLAGVFSGVAMSLLWPRLGQDTLNLILAFLLVVALPAHAFVVGFGRASAVATGAVDTSVLKRVAIWLLAAIVAIAVVQTTTLS